MPQWLFKPAGQFFALFFSTQVQGPWLEELDREEGG
jgi:hypothetical protein